MGSIEPHPKNQQLDAQQKIIPNPTVQTSGPIIRFSNSFFYQRSTKRSESAAPRSTGLSRCGPLSPGNLASPRPESEQLWSKLPTHGIIMESPGESGENRWEELGRKRQMPNHDACMFVIVYLAVHLLLKSFCVCYTFSFFCGQCRAAGPTGVMGMPKRMSQR